jgi:hypothetical protein
MDCPDNAITLPPVARLSGYFLDQMGTIPGTVAELREEKRQDVAV